MIRMTRRTVATASAVAALLTSCLCATPPAQADPLDLTNPLVNQLTKQVTKRVNETVHGQAKVRRYWTAKRMRHAIPLNVGPGPNWKPSKVKKGKPVVIKAARAQNYKAQDRSAQQNSSPSTADRASTASYAGGPWGGGGRIARTAGKVFMTLRGVDYVCSGDVIPAQNKSIVVTAGHCVNDGDGAFVTNFEFVPGYRDGSAPYGEWAASQVVTTSQWANQGDHNYDVGFAVMGEWDGWTIQNLVGSEGLGFNQSRGQFTYAFGYPATSPYNGEVLDYAYGTTGQDTYGGSSDQRMTNSMTSGSSGGPWLQNFDASTGVGIQTSLNSYGYVGESNAMYGPYFGSTIESVYNYAQDQ